MIDSTLAVALLAALLAAPPKPLDAEALRARYGHLTALSAEISQVKEGRFWARPMRSSIRLRWTPARIEWETRSPVRSLAVIEGDALALTDSRGQTRSLGASGDPRLQALLSLLRAFLSLDLSAIERQYVLRFDGRELVAELRPEATVRVFHTLRFRFDEALALQSLELEADGEKTRLVFDRLVLESPRSATP